MKNLHLIQTDRPSRLHLWTDERGTRLELCDLEYSHTRNTQHIYITSDEEIEDDNWVYCDHVIKQIIQVKRFRKSGNDDNVILISDNNFKEVWLSKSKKIILTTDQSLDGVQKIDNEFIEWFVNNPRCEWVEVRKRFSDFTVEPFVGYKIIIPQEDAKWQAQRMYSDAIEFGKWLDDNTQQREYYPMSAMTMEELFEEFKKK